MAWKYFFILIGFLSALYSIPILFTVPGILQNIQHTIEITLPDNFTAEVKQGTLLISGSVQPLIIRPSEYNAVIVLDTISTSTPSLSTYIHEEDRGGVLVSRDTIEIYNGLQTQAWYVRDFKDGRVTKNDLLHIIIKLRSSVVLPLFLIGLVVAIIVGVIVWKLWVLIWVVLSAWIISQIFHRKWRFGELFIMALYAITLPSVVSIILTLSGILVPWLHFIIFWAFMVAIVLTKSLTEIKPNSQKSDTPPSLSN